MSTPEESRSRFAAWCAGAKEALEDLLFPYDMICPLCKRYLVGGEHIICEFCEEKLSRCALGLPEQLSRHEPIKLCISAFSHTGAAKELIHTLKYKNDATIAPLLGLHLCAALLHTLGSCCWDAVVPVPLHPDRLAARGYNQAQLLADAVAFHWQSTVRNDLLYRIKKMGSQTRRSRAQRREAMEGAFTATPLAAGLRILLVDDVLTTGATACACTKALLAAGAAEVILLTVCQA